MWKSLFNAFCRVFYCRCHSDCDLSTGAKASSPNYKNAKTSRSATGANYKSGDQPIDLTSED